MRSRAPKLSETGEGGDQDSHDDGRRNQAPAAPGADDERFQVSEVGGECDPSRRERQQEESGLAAALPSGLKSRQRDRQKSRVAEHSVGSHREAEDHRVAAVLYHFALAAGAAGEFAHHPQLPEPEVQRYEEAAQRKQGGGHSVDHRLEEAAAALSMSALRAS